MYMHVAIVLLKYIAYINHICVYTCIGIANALWAAGSIGIPVQEQSETMAAAMWSSIAEALQGCSGWELTNIVWYVNKM